VNLKVQDYYPSGKRFFLRFKEKGGKEKELPVHHKLEELLDEYLKVRFSANGRQAELGSLLWNVFRLCAQLFRLHIRGVRVREDQN
jgi:hypothetical protein